LTGELISRLLLRFSDLNYQLSKDMERKVEDLKTQLTEVCDCCRIINVFSVTPPAEVSNGYPVFGWATYFSVRPPIHRATKKPQLAVDIFFLRHPHDIVT